MFFGREDHDRLRSASIVKIEQKKTRSFPLHQFRIISSNKCRLRCRQRLPHVMSGMSPDPSSVKDLIYPASSFQFLLDPPGHGFDLAPHIGA
jgi:hypothetical protein